MNGLEFAAIIAGTLAILLSIGLATFLAKVENSKHFDTAYLIYANSGEYDDQWQYVVFASLYKDLADKKCAELNKEMEEKKNLAKKLFPNVDYKECVFLEREELDLLSEEHYELYKCLFHENNSAFDVSEVGLIF